MPQASGDCDHLAYKSNREILDKRFKNINISERLSPHNYMDFLRLGYKIKVIGWPFILVLLEYQQKRMDFKGTKGGRVRFQSHVWDGIDSHLVS